MWLLASLKVKGLRNYTKFCKGQIVLNPHGYHGNHSYNVYLNYHGNHSYNGYHCTVTIVTMVTTVTIVTMVTTVTIVTMVTTVTIVTIVTRSWLPR